MSAELIYKVLVVGVASVGKTCLIRRYVHSVFNESTQATIAVDFSIKVLPMKDHTVTLRLWDIQGQDQPGYMARTYYNGAVGAIIVADILRPETLDLAAQWKQDVDSKVQLPNSSKPIPCVLVLNKCDAGKNSKTKEEMDSFCVKNGFVGWYESSAKADINVARSFDYLVSQISEAIPFEPSCTSAASGTLTGLPPKQPTSGASSSSRGTCCRKN